MKEEEREILYREYIPEREVYTSRGLTQEEYIIRKFEEATGEKFDPRRHEIVEENNAFDDLYDNPLATYLVVRNKPIIIVDGPPTPPPQPPTHEPGNTPGGTGGTRGPGDTPGGTKKPGDGPTGPFVPGGIGGLPPRGPQKPGDDPGNEPTGPENEPQGPGNEPQGPGNTPGEPGNGPQPPKGPTKGQGPGKPGNEPRKPGDDPRKPEDEPKKPGDDPKKPEDEPKKPGDDPKKPGDDPKKPEDEPEKPKPPVKPPEGKNPPKPPIPPVRTPLPIPPEKPVPTPRGFNPRPPEKTPEEKEKEYLVQDMLDKYYGNRKKRKEYKERFKRFKSHMIEKEFQFTDENGYNQTGKLITIDTSYPEYQEDVQFLQLQEYAFRLERYSRYVANDRSLYLRKAYDFIELQRAKGTPFEGTIDELVDALVEEDYEYLETYNYTYNTHRATNENLSTLGKHGEDVPKLVMDNDKTVKAKLGNVIRHLANACIIVRKYTSAPIHRLVGKGIKAVHGRIFDPDFQPSGIYRGKMTHRYQARKIYYLELYLDELGEENAKREANGQPKKKINYLKAAFMPRIKAIFSYREGNIAVLNAGAYDIDTCYDRIQRQKIQREREIQAQVQVVQDLQQRIDAIEEKINNPKGPYSTEERTRDLYDRNLLYVKLIEAMQQLDIIERDGESIIQTDAIALETHDMANKENMTRVVTGVKMVARAAIAAAVGPRLTKVIKGKKREPVPREVTRTVTDEPTYVPGHWEERPGTTTQTVVNDVKLTDIGTVTPEGKFTLGVIPEQKGPITVTRSAAGGRTKRLSENIELRGFYVNGESGGDEVGFNLAFTKADGTKGMRAQTHLEVSPDDSVFDLLARIKTGKGHPTTGAEILEQIRSKDDQIGEFMRMFADTQLWVSKHGSEIPEGWIVITDLLEEAVKRKATIQEVPTIIREWVEGHIVEGTPREITETIIDYATIEVTKRVIDWHGAAFAAAITAGTINDINNEARRTRSKQETIEEISYGYPEADRKKPRKTEAKRHQRDNKHRLGKRQYGYRKYAFDGTKHGDRVSGYNEAGKGTPGDYVEGRSRGR